MSRVLHDRVASIANALVISPHMDDAVFSCGAFMAAHPGCTVLTVFAGIPADKNMQTEWDRHCGFGDAATAQQARRVEDQRATAALQAHCRWLDFIDDQYAPRSDERDLAPAIRDCVRSLVPAAVLMPFGLFHSDHLRVSEACITLLLHHALDLSHALCIAYEDALYRRQAGATQGRLCAFANRGIVATPVSPSITPQDYARKRHAVEQYA
ncbi:MAG: LmbE family protein, partial [Rhodocyclales bacterium]|nr:LmbE family protein [Rhodocyclales bacterium]